MQLSIRESLFLVSFVFTCLIVANGVFVTMLQEGQDGHASIESRRYASLNLALEMKQSSDELTRFARTFVLTQDTRFEDYYNVIIAIRDGKQAHPKNYTRVYWDQVASGAMTLDTEGETYSIADRMVELGFSDQEQEKIAESKWESDDLVNLELTAMNAVKGLFRDREGRFTRKGAPDLGLARSLLHSPQYHQAKSRIMKPLDDFFTLLEFRTANEFSVKHFQNQAVIWSITGLTIVTIGFAIFVFFLLKRRIISPLRALEVGAREIGEGNYGHHIELQSHDEIGTLSDTFNSMSDGIEERAQALEDMVEKLRAAKEVAEDATQLKDKFVSLIAHDLRSPLGGIKGLVEFMLMDTRSPLGDNARSSMELIFDQIKQLLDLLESLLDLSRFQTGNIHIEPRFFDAHYLADDILNRLRHQADPKGISLINDIPLRTRIHADEKLLGQVLQNLVSNAIKFSHPNEQVRVYVPDNLPATIAVIDRGVGIPHDVIEKLFQLEEQTSTPGTAGESGTGFGLPLSRQIVQAHDGDIRVESTEGEGSTFFADLPQVVPTVLVVDDDAGVRALIQAHLLEEGVVVEEAENGRIAMDYISRNKAPHLVITDIDMPEMDGFELLSTAMKTPGLETVPFIVLTASDTEDVRDKCLSLGAADFTQKPIVPKDFMPRVRHFIG